MRKLVIFATPSEAAATIQQQDAQQIAECLYSYSDGLISICGIGLHKAQAAVLENGRKCDEVWNLGLAGALQNLPLCKLVSIGTVGKYVPIDEIDAHSLQLMERIIPPFQLEGKYNLISSDFPIHSPKHRPKGFDLVDMEGYGIAFAAHYLGKKCRMWKIISDFASPNGEELIRQNKAKLSQLLAEKVENESSSHP